MSRRTAAIRAALRRRRATTITVGVALAALVTTGGGELTARQIIQDRIAHATSALGNDLQVGEGGDWALWDLAHQHIPRLDISSDDARLGPLSQVAIQAQLDDIRLGGKATVGSSQVQVTVPAQSIAAAIRAAAPSLPVHAVKPDPRTGTIAVAVGPGGIGQLTLRPAVKDGKVSLAADGLTVFGRSVPTSRLGQIDGSLGSGTQRAYPLGLEATSARVQPDGLKITLTGGASTLGGA